MCVTQSAFMPILYLTPCTFYFFAELQSYSYCQALFFFLKKNKFLVHPVTLFTYKMFIPLSSLVFFLLKKMIVLVDFYHIIY